MPTMRPIGIDADAGESSPFPLAVGAFVGNEVIRFSTATAELVAFSSAVALYSRLLAVKSKVNWPDETDCSRACVSEVVVTLALFTRISYVTLTEALEVAILRATATTTTVVDGLSVTTRFRMSPAGTWAVSATVAMNAELQVPELLDHSA